MEAVNRPTQEEELGLRQALIAACLALNARGINQGTSGNISLRCGDRMLISPSATAYEDLTPEMIAAMPLQGPPGIWEGPLAPSTEWRFHHDILRQRPETQAVIHAHPTFCTALAIARRDIPPCHYMIAAFGGPSVRCSDYALFGTEALSRTALAALEGRQACLLANHGMIVTGESLAKALWRAEELEALAKQYYHSLQIGGPVLLSEAEIAEASAAFQGYGRRD